MSIRYSISDCKRKPACTCSSCAVLTPFPLSPPSSSSPVAARPNAIYRNIADMSTRYLISGGKPKPVCTCSSCAVLTPFPLLLSSSSSLPYKPSSTSTVTPPNALKRGSSSPSAKSRPKSRSAAEHMAEFKVDFAAERSEKRRSSKKGSRRSKKSRDSDDRAVGFTESVKDWDGLTSRARVLGLGEAFRGMRTLHWYHPEVQKSGAKLWERHRMLFLVWQDA